MELYFKKMKMKIFLFFLLNLSCVAHAKIKLAILFKQSDCISCTAPINRFLGIADKTELTFYVEKSASDFFEEFIRDFDAYDPKNKIHVVYIAAGDFKKYNLTNENTSTCFIFNGDLLVKKFELKDYSENVSWILTTLTGSSKILKEESLETIKLSERTDAYCYNNNYLIYDYLLNKILIIDLGTLKLSTIKAQDFKNKNLVIAAGYDTTLYQSLVPTLKQFNKYKPRIQTIAPYKNSLYISMALTLPDFDEKDTILGSDFFIIKYNGASAAQIQHLKNTALKAKHHLFIDETGPFYIKDKNIHVSVYNGDPNEKRLFAVYSPAKETYTFDQISSLTRSGLHAYYDTIAQANTAKINHGVYFYSLYPFCIDIDKAITYDYYTALNNYNKQNLKDLYIQDVYQDDENFYMLSFFKQDLHYFILNKETQRISFSKKIQLKINDQNYLNLQLIDKSKLVYFDALKNKLITAEL